MKRFIQPASGRFLLAGFLLLSMWLIWQKRSAQTAVNQAAAAVPALTTGLTTPQLIEAAVPALTAGLTTPQLIEAAVPARRIDRETADRYLLYALANDSRLPAAYRSAASWSGTLPLLALQQRLQKQPTDALNSELQSLLTGSCGGWDGFGPDHDVLDTAHFHIQYAPIGSGLTINDYAAALETAWTTQIDLFGWAQPPLLAANPPPGGRYHVRVEPLSPGLLGFVTFDGVHAGLVGNNPATPWNEGDAYATCMVLNWDVGSVSSLNVLRTAVTRELHHAIQYGYGVLSGANVPDPVFVDGSAAWMEDEVYDSANLNYTLLWPNFSSCMGQYNGAADSYWLVWRAFTERYVSGVSGGAEQVMQDFWEGMSQRSDDNFLAALDTALVNRGSSLSAAFHEYAIAAKFNKSCGSSSYTYPTCFREAAAYTAAAGATAVHGTIPAVDGSYSGLLADNYSLNWVALPTGTATYDVVVRNAAVGGRLRGSLICDTGTALMPIFFPDVVGPGQSTTLQGYNPAGCSQVVAVLTNEAETAGNPPACSSRSYELRVQSPGPNLAASTLSVAPATVPAGQVVTFTARLINDGSTAAAAVFSATLPAALQIVGLPTASSGSPPTVNGQNISWSGAVGIGGEVVIQYAALLLTDTPLISRAWIDDGLGSRYRRYVLLNGAEGFMAFTVK